MGTQIILRAPFAQLLFPYQTNFDKISKQHLEKTILFPFSQKPRIKELNPLFSKQNQINFLKEDISFKHIEQQLL